MSEYLFTSESVSEGHPDKICDQISDAVLDAFLTNDVKMGVADDSQANSRVACETLTTTNKIVIAGEVRGSAPLTHRYGSHTVVNREYEKPISPKTPNLRFGVYSAPNDPETPSACDVRDTSPMGGTIATRDSSRTILVPVSMVVPSSSTSNRG